MSVITASSVYALPGDARLGRALFVRASAWLAVLIVITVYLWIVSAGTWTKWPSYGHGYYQDLADGFRNGQLALASKPKPELLALNDPYDPVANEGLRIHDVSLYNGKFYLYWGPVPAVLLMAANLVGVPKVGDQYLVFFFAVGTLGLSARLILRLWRRYFLETVPAWGVPLAILTIGLANPAPFNLARASIYEAAIAAAQMFMVGGIYFVVTGLFDGRASWGRLLLAGLMFACAVGSRASMALPVAGIVLLTIWQVIRLGRPRRHVKTRDEAAERRVAPPSGVPHVAENVGFSFLMPRGDQYWRQEVRPPRVVPLLCFLFPLLIGAAALGWYNRARFGSPAELGVRYQLAGFNSFKNIHTLTSPRNAPPNVYSYLLRPPLVTSVFPYLVPRSGYDGAFPSWLPVPEFHNRDATVTGMLLVTPFVIFAAVALGRRRGIDVGGGAGETDEFFFSTRWIAAMLVVTVILSALPALILSFGTMRYLADWSIPLMLLAVIGYWRGAAARVDRPWSRRIWLAVGMVLMSVTVLSGPLLGVTGALDHLARHNPALLQRLVEVTYRGPVPGVAQISGPAGIDLMDGGGWWLGTERAAVDVIVQSDGSYDVNLTTTTGPGLNGTSGTLRVGADPGKALPQKERQIVAELTVPHDASAVRFQTHLQAGLNRLFLSTDTGPARTPDERTSRRLIGVLSVDIRPTSATSTATATVPATTSASSRR